MKMRISLILFFSLLGLFFMELEADAAILHAIEIHHEGWKTTPEEIRKILPLQEGNFLHEEDIEKAISFLNKWGRFQTVEVQRKKDPQGIRLVFHVKEGWVVRRISINGNRPYMKSRIRRRLGVRPGEIYNSEVAHDNMHRLRRFYESEGYFGTQVSLKETYDEKKGTVALSFVIKKGKRLRLGRFEVDGNHVFVRGYFLSKINPLAPYQPRRLKRGIEKIEQAYKKKGYPRARVRVEKIDYDWENSRAHLTLSVFEGDHLVLSFRGNHDISRKTLKDIATFFTEGSYDVFEMRQSEEKIAEFYLQHGFPDVKVRAEKEEIKPGRLRIIFHITEGKNVRVKKILFPGRQKLSGRKIKKEILTQQNTPSQKGYYRTWTVEKDPAIIQKLYQKEGFPDALVTDGVMDWNYFRDKITVSFPIQEGKRLYVRSIQFEALPQEWIKKITKRIHLAVEKPFQEDSLKFDKEQIAIVAANQGHPYATVEDHATVSEDGTSVDVVYVVHPGPSVRVGEILIVGHSKTRTQTILKTMSIHEGDLFHYEKVLESAANLRRLGAFHSANVETIGLLEEEPVVHLVVRVEEAERFETVLKGTYSTDDRLSAGVLFKNPNLFGYGKRGNLSLIGGQDLSEGRVSFIDPRFFGTGLELIIEGFTTYEQRTNFTALESGGSFSLVREFGSRVTLLTKYELSRAIFTKGVNDQDITLPHLLLSFNYDSRDNYADPNGGLYGLVSTEMFNEILGVGANFLKLGGQVIHYQGLSRRLTFSNSFRVGGIQTFSSATTIPSTEAFFLGGDFSIRGFNQDAASPLAGAKVSLIYNLEAQFKIYRQVEGAAFLDTGSLTNNFQDIGLASWRHSAGLGLRYITPVGPVRLDYAAILDRAVGEPFGRLHFTFGYAF